MSSGSQLVPVQAPRWQLRCWRPACLADSRSREGSRATPGLGSSPPLAPWPSPATENIPPTIQLKKQYLIVIIINLNHSTTSTTISNCLSDHVSYPLQHENNFYV